MSGPIYAELAPVRHRQQRALATWSTVVGLLVSSTAGVVLGVSRMVAGWPASPLVGLAVLAAGPVLGLIVGLAWRRSWHDAAAAVDVHYDLKDRAITALEFLTKPEATTLQELEVADTAERLGRVVPREVVPMRMPRLLPYAVALLAAAAVLIVWPLGTQTAVVQAAEPIPEIQNEANKISEDLKQLDELVRETQNKELEGLLNELKGLVEEMKEPGVDVKEALAKLSEMQTAIQAQQAQYNVCLVDGHLASLGAAMTAADSLEAAGKALQEGKFEKAAKELEALDDPEFNKKEAKTVEEKMKQVAEKMGEVGLGEFSDATCEMCEGMRGNKGKFKKGAKTLAGLTRNQAQRKRIAEILDIELNRLSECKGNCESNKVARGRKPEKSISPTNQWGLTTSGNVQGDKTNMLSKRNMEEITGNPGENGDSEMETTHSPEGRQQAQRGLRESYDKYKKESEAVLDSEPIPLGHRQTIRKYFELIRPQNNDGESKPDAQK